MSCKYAKFDEDNWYTCSITEDSCIFIVPNKDACDKRYPNKNKGLSKCKKEDC